MSEQNFPLGKYISEYVRNLQKEVETELSKLSVNHEEWAIDVHYSFQFSPDRKIRDYFLITVVPYINDNRQGFYKFKLKSIEMIFVKEVCHLIYQITANPENADSLIDGSKVNLEYLLD